MIYHGPLEDAEAAIKAGGSAVVVYASTVSDDSWLLEGEIIWRDFTMQKKSNLFWR